MNENIKQEFLKHIENKPLVKGSVIHLHTNDEDKRFYLINKWDEKDLAKFINEINLNYSSGYGVQELYGIIWFTDGTWSERAEYDGAEWWAYKKCPDLVNDSSGCIECAYECRKT